MFGVLARSKGGSVVTVRNDADFHMGVLVSLAVIYANGQEVVAEELVNAVGPKELLRLAKKENDIALPALRKTVSFFRSRERNLFRRIDRPSNDQFDEPDKETA